MISKSDMAAKNSTSVDSLRCYSVVLETAAAEYKGMNAKGDAMRPKICIKYNKHGTVPIAEILSGKNARAWVSTVLCLKKKK